jgi:hypothetical protein
MHGDLKLTFINQCLTQYMESVIETMRVMFRRYNIGISDEALKSLAYEQLQRSANLKFKEYLRMVDMGAGRGHPLGGLKAVSVALQSRNKVADILVKDRTRKPKPVYSKTAYGKLTWLENKLLHGFTEETIAVLKQNMEASNQ